MARWILAVALVGLLAFTGSAQAKGKKGKSAPIKMAGTIARVEQVINGLQLKVTADTNGSQCVMFLSKTTKITVSGKADMEHIFMPGEHIQVTLAGAIASAIDVDKPAK